MEVLFKKIFFPDLRFEGTFIWGGEWGGLFRIETTLRNKLIFLSVGALPPRSCDLVMFVRKKKKAKKKKMDGTEKEGSYLPKIQKERRPSEAGHTTRFYGFGISTHLSSLCVLYIFYINIYCGWPPWRGVAGGLL